MQIPHESSYQPCLPKYAFQSYFLLVLLKKNNAWDVSLHVVFNNKNSNALHPATFMRGNAISLVSLMKSLKDAGHFS